VIYEPYGCPLSPHSICIGRKYWRWTFFFSFPGPFLSEKNVIDDLRLTRAKDFFLSVSVISFLSGPNHRKGADQIWPLSTSPFLQTPYGQGLPVIRLFYKGLFSPCPPGEAPLKEAGLSDHPTHLPGFRFFGGPLTPIVIFSPVPLFFPLLSFQFFFSKPPTTEFIFPLRFPSLPSFLNLLGWALAVFPAGPPGDPSSSQA